MGKRKNPIAEQSRIWLIQSLLSLMDQKSYHRITISEITDNAGLSRRTFYRLFHSKEEVLEDYFEVLFDEYTDCFRNETDLSYHRIVEVYFTFWEQHLDTLRILKKNHLFFYVVEKYNKFLPELHDIFKRDQQEYDSPDALAYALRFSGGGLWNVLSEWVLNPSRQSPGEMADMISKAVEINT